MPSFEVPPIEPIFSLECLKLNEMKNLFKLIFKQLTRMDAKLDDIPDFTKIIKDVSFLKKDQVEQWDYLRNKFKEI